MSLNDLKAFLQDNGPASAADACRALGISQPTFSRLIRAMRRDIVIGGEARATRYALRRVIPDVEPVIPITEINEQGEAFSLADLHPVWPRGFYLQRKDKSEWFDDLPFFLDDLRPNGFLGRLVPLRHPDLANPADIRLWNADHVLAYLTRFEPDGIGNLIVGSESLRRHLSSGVFPKKTYPKMADDVLQHGPAGSSAGGEQPKFLTVREPGNVPVLVKFSPPINDGISRRMADLLVCEHIAHRILASSGFAAPRSRLVKGGGRFFLEIERFDRIGSGRRGLITLGALDAQFAGRLGSWSETARALLQEGIIDEAARSGIVWLDCFGALIADTDRHPGNLSFLTEKLRPTGLAPAYDRLPMLYFPRHGQLIEQNFAPVLPSGASAEGWKTALIAAKKFWRAVSGHPHISADFKKIARQNAERLTGIGP